jgi:hypothetical protein
MGLKFNYTKIKGFEKMDKSEHDNLNLFAWLLMSVHMQTVKEANIDEIFWRLKFLQKIKQELFSGLPADDTEIKKFLTKHIGYYTNVGTEPRNKFIQHYVQVIAAEVTQDINNN